MKPVSNIEAVAKELTKRLMAGARDELVNIPGFLDLVDAVLISWFEESKDGPATICIEASTEPRVEFKMDGADIFLSAPLQLPDPEFDVDDVRDDLHQVESAADVTTAQNTARRYRAMADMMAGLAHVAEFRAGLRDDAPPQHS